MTRVYWVTCALMIMPCAGKDDVCAATVSALTLPAPPSSAVRTFSVLYFVSVFKLMHIDC